MSSPGHYRWVTCSSGGGLLSHTVEVLPERLTPVRWLSACCDQLPPETELSLISAFAELPHLHTGHPVMTF